MLLTTLARIGWAASTSPIPIPKEMSLESLKILNEGLVFMGLLVCASFHRNSPRHPLPRLTPKRASPPLHRQHQECHTIAK